ncbi:unnamed protein product, partial [Effrenium voratum]
MPEITKSVKFDNIAREWRCKWSADGDKASLEAAQKVLEDVLADLSSVEGVSSVQRVVCGGCLDFKVVTKLSATAFGEWEKAKFAPEEEFLSKLKAIPGISTVETQTYTLEEVKLNKKDIKKAQEKKEKAAAAAAEAAPAAPEDPAKKLKKVLKEGGKRGVEIEGAADMGGLQWAGPRLGLAHPRQRNGPKMIKKGKELEDKKILSKVSGFALPGELLAIMGPSGAGKTSLLNCLAVRTAPSSGALSFNSMELSKAVKRKVAYVHQQEMLLECYTPREHLLFQSKLRMPSSVGAEARKLRVEASIKMLGLEKCQHSLIGDVYSGISKNEKRRVSFATEILTQPSVLYCDEPTTGLDSVMAEVIVKYMKAIALAGNNGQKVTVIASVHQPSSQVFRLFDRLHFLIDGRTAYFGQLSKLEEHFAKIGFQMPDHTMPADFVMKLCINPRDPEGAAKRRVEISDAWDKQWPNEDARIHGAPIQVIPKAVSEMPVEEKHTNWFVSLLYLTKRE